MPIDVKQYDVKKEDRKELVRVAVQEVRAAVELDRKSVLQAYQEMGSRSASNLEATESALQDTIGISVDDIVLALEDTSFASELAMLAQAHSQDDVHSRIDELMNA